jgi:hypothetical protein
MQPELVPLPAARVGPAPIYVIRGERMVLDQDLARLFGVETRRLTEQLRRNLRRFEGYAVHLEPGEYENLMSQNAASSFGHGGRRKPPWAFTEHGVVMAATILNSDVAIAAMRMVVEVFVAQRRARALAQLSGTTAGLVPRLQRALEGLLDSIVDHRSQTTLREEAQALLAQSIQHLKDRLGRQGLENEEIAARAVKLLADAEASKASAAKTQAEAGEIELRLLARKLRLVIEAERAIAVEDLGAFLSVLEDLGRA